MLRVAHQLGAAADLLVDRGRPADITPTERQVAITHTAGLLAAAAQITTQATIHDLSCAATASSAAVLTQACARVLEVGPQGSLAGLDRAGAMDRPPVDPADPADPVSGLDAAVHDWRRAALVAADAAAPSSQDLRTSALTAGRLSAFSQVLLAVHLPERSNAAQQAVRHAGHGWNQVAQAWQTFTLPAPASTELALAARQVDVAVRLLAHDGPRWATPEQIAARADPGAALQVGRRALAHVRDVAADHAHRTEAYMRSRWVLGRADRLPGLPQRLTQATRKQWVPVYPVEGAPLAHAYGAAVWATQQASTSYTAATSPQHPADPTRDLLAGIEQRGAGRRNPGPRSRRSGNPSSIGGYSSGGLEP